jgi:hypothetical protein
MPGPFVEGRIEMTKLEIELWLARLAVLGGTLLFVKYRDPYIRYTTSIYLRMGEGFWIGRKGRFYAKRDVAGVVRFEWALMLAGLSVVTLVFWSTAFVPQQP